jgi:hypothetical protein
MTDIATNGTCSMCGRFIGPESVCPFCGASGQSRLSLRVLRRVALVVSILGLGLVWFIARQSPPPLVAIADLTPTMNYALVTVRGVVPRAPRIHKTGSSVDYLSFQVADGTNTLYVFASSPLAARLVDEQRLPGPGAAIDVTGTLTLRDSGSLRLRIQRAEALQLSANHAINAK